MVTSDGGVAVDGGVGGDKAASGDAALRRLLPGALHLRAVWTGGCLLAAAVVCSRLVERTVTLRRQTSAATPSSWRRRLAVAGTTRAFLLCCRSAGRGESHLCHAASFLPQSALRCLSIHT